MAYYAQIVNDIVTEVIVVNDDVPNGAQFCHDLLGGVWVQTSFNNRIRKQFAGVGFTYDSNADVFIVPQPFESWTLDNNFDWQPPTPQPSAPPKTYWDEDTQTWLVYD